MVSCSCGAELGDASGDSCPRCSRPLTRNGFVHRYRVRFVVVGGIVGFVVGGLVVAWPLGYLMGLVGLSWLPALFAVAVGVGTIGGAVVGMRLGLALVKYEANAKFTPTDD